MVASLASSSSTIATSDAQLQVARGRPARYRATDRRASRAASRLVGGNARASRRGRSDVVSVTHGGPAATACRSRLSMPYSYRVVSPRSHSGEAVIGALSPTIRGPRLPRARRRLTLASPMPHEIMSTIKAICVYCGSGPGTDPAFVEAARNLRPDPGRERHRPRLWRRLDRPDGRGRRRGARPRRPRSPASSRTS